MCPSPECRLGRFQLCISPSFHTSLPSSQAPPGLSPLLSPFQGLRSCWRHPHIPWAGVGEAEPQQGRSRLW